MWFRQMFYRWLIPAAFVLPLWLLIGWGVFQAGGWAFLWVLFMAVPSVFIGQLVFSLLIRSRGTVRADRAVSWQDIAVMGTWHVVTIVVGTFPQHWFGLLLTLAIALAIAVLWSSLGQLWSEAKGRTTVLLDAGMPASTFGQTASSQFGSSPFGSSTGASAPVDGDVIIVTEKRED